MYIFVHFLNIYTVQKLNCKAKFVRFTLFYRQNIKLNPVSKLREKYAAGKLFNVNDDVVTNDGQKGIINKLGSNHVEVKLKGDGKFKNFWLSDIIIT